MGSISAPKTWLITGASQGLGLQISLAALNAGHKVIAGARNLEKAQQEHPELEKAGGKWLKLDVSLPDTQKVVEKALEEAGSIDVVVNNAGAVTVGTIEELS
jgi:NAD(P)-dependent dehydrogenase (short-subunit alcohol dehydrogenase family)